MAARLKERYAEEIRPQLLERFGYSSVMQVPRLEKITLNMGVGEAKQNTAMLEAAIEQMTVIAGQKPAVRRARKSIAGFKLREGMPVGVMATLRGERMWEMLDRLQSIALPRVRDFRGLSPRSFDGRGNYSMGIREQIIFPEIDYDSIDQVRGLNVTITTQRRPTTRPASCCGCSACRSGGTGTRARPRPRCGRSRRPPSGVQPRRQRARSWRPRSPTNPRNPRRARRRGARGLGERRRAAGRRESE